MPVAAGIAYGGLAAIMAHQACAGAGVLRPYSPMRGREARAAGSVAAPFSFMHRTMRPCAQAAQLKGIVMILCDGEPLGDIAYAASITGSSST
jgi:hypothetical protein